ETFSAPPPAADATPATQTAGTSMPPASTDATKSTDPSVAAALPPPVSALGSLASTSIVGTADGTQLTLNGPATWAGVSGSLTGSLAITPGTTPSDPVRIDGAVTFVAADGTTKTMRVAMRATAATDSGGLTTYAVSAGRYEMTDATGTTATGSFTGSIQTGS